MTCPVSGVLNDLVHPVDPAALPELEALRDLIGLGPWREHGGKSNGVFYGLCGALAHVCSTRLQG